ncbi:FAD/NAD-P-binding domain-containing protein [Trametes meyenii]|nr:FAD/NAD-P-binding domain-containing protein [Trametes meyenii]
MPKFTVAIAGAGLGGLAFAVALRKYAPDIDFHLYEATGELATAGAGIAAQPRTWFVLKDLGLEDALLRVAGNGDTPSLPALERKSDEPQGFTFNEIVATENTFTFHRGDLQRVLIDHVGGSERIHLNKQVESYTQSADPSEKITVHFADGTTAKCDLLVGADGIKSRVREAMYTRFSNAAKDAGRDGEAEFLESCIHAVFSGTFGYRALLRRDPAKMSEPYPSTMTNLVLYCGKNKHIVAYPIMQGRVLNLLAIILKPELEGTVYEGPWMVKAPKEEVQEYYIGWEREVDDIMQAVDTWNRWAINVVKKLPTFVDGRVALLGDAAHAMTPYLGAGAGQGFEDAFILARLLGQPDISRNKISLALKIYDQIRRPVAQDVAARSWECGKTHCFYIPQLDGVTPEMSSSGNSITREDLKNVAQRAEKLQEWREGTTIAGDLQVALRFLGEELAKASAPTRAESHL